MPYRIADEVAVHDLLEAHGLPVPHAYGLCDAPYALVMDRLPGLVDLSFAADDDEREHLVDDYLDLLARIYAIPLDDAVAAGFAMPADAAATGLSFLRRMEERYDRSMEGLPPDPIAVFLRRWLAENVPQHRHAEARFITYDSFQFMFADGRITGLLDFEHAHVGDPMMDLAALRIRDTLKNLGDLAETGARYEATTGVVIDHDVVDYHTVLYNALSVISVGPPLADPLRGTDWVSYLAWYVNGARWAFEVIAEMRGYELEPVAVPDARPTRHAPAYRHLVDSLRAAGSGASSTTTSASGSVGSRATSGGSTRSGRHSTPPTSTTWPRCSGTVRTRRKPTPSSSSSWRARGRSTRRHWSVSSTRERSACTSAWRRPSR